MTRYLLDTNVISNVVKPSPPEPLLAWMADRDDADLYIASLTVAEIWRGILQTPSGRKHKALATWFTGPEGPQALFAGRVLPFDERAGLQWAQLMADGKSRGRPRNALDMIIASIARSNDCIIVTDNEKDFADIEFVNPLAASDPAFRAGRIA